MTYLFHQFLERPIFNALIFIYNSLPDFGVAVIILTILIRFLIYPFSQKALESQKELASISPQIKEIREKFKDNKEDQARALLSLYKEKKINPFKGLLTFFIQIPIFIALFLVLKNGLDLENFNVLYSFIEKPASLNTFFLGLIDLSKPSLGLAILVGISQFIQSKIILDYQKKLMSGASNNDLSFIVGRQMTYVSPFLAVLISSNLSGGLSLYWVTTNIFSIFQQQFLFQK